MLVTLWDTSEGEECKIKESFLNSREISAKLRKRENNTPMISIFFSK